jgi:hypothetical protein
MAEPEHDSIPELVAWLEARGHSADEIDHILKRLQKYDELTTADALMDAIARGEVDLQAIVDEFKDH